MADRSPALSRATPASPLSCPVALNITQEDINSGVPGSGRQCPIALALNRLHPGWKFNLKGENPTVVKEDGETYALKLDRVVVDWIGKFDRGEEVKPWTLYTT